MKLIFPLIIGLLIVTHAFSQELYDKQEFKIQNIKIDTIDDSHNKLGISLRFDVEFKYPIEKFLYDEYKITAVIKDKNGNIIYSNPEKFVKVSAKPDYKNKKTSIEKDAYLFVPINDINIADGIHIINIELHAKNNSIDFKSIYSRNIAYNKLKLYDYSKQEFTIKDFEAKATQLSGQNGINITLDCFYKYVSQLIKSNYTDEGSYYYFYVTIFDKNKNLVFSPTEDIIYFRLTEYVQRLALGEGKKDEISLFISNRKLNLPEGKSNLEVRLNVTNEKRDIVFKDIANTNVQVVQEAFYLVEVDITNLTIAYSDNYDVANVFGQIFSKRSKNKGRGYPDVYWKITTGYDNIYSSGVVDNAFYGFDGKTNFRITESDPVWFEVYDFDKISQNDFIAAYQIKHTKGNYSLEKENFKYKNIESVNLKFNKTKQASILCKDISFDNNRVNGISGVDVLFTFVAKDITQNTSLKVTPFWIDENMQVREIKYFSELHNESYKETPAFIISSATNDGVIKIHIPYYEVKTKAKIGFKAELMNYNLLVASMVSNKTIVIPTIDDIGFNILKIEDAKQDGLFGVLYNTEFNMPSEYRNNIGKSNFTFETDLINKQDNSDFSKYTINSDSNQYSCTGFIPYHMLKGFNTELNLTVKYKASITSTGLTVGEGAKDFYIKKPELQNMKLSQLSLKYNTKETAYEKVKIVILHGKNVGYESSVIEIAKKINFDNMPEFIAHNNDDITFKLIGLDSFMQETELSTNVFLASDLINKSSVKLKGENPIKKSKLIFKK